MSGIGSRADEAMNPATSQCFYASKHIMKTLLQIITFIVASLPAFCQTNFDRGFYNGYKKGYCLNAGVSCLPPLPPLSPLPQIGENLNSYQDGYNRGFETGLSAQSGNSNERQRYKTSSSEPIEYIQRQNLNDIKALAKVLKDAKGKAFELQEAGDFQASINIALAGLKVIPKDAEFLILAGNGYLQLRNYQEALKYLKRAEKSSSDSALRELIREIENGTYQKELAEEERTSIPEKSDYNTELNKEIIQYVNAKNFKKALELADKLVSQSNSWQSLELRGYINYLSKNYSDCIADYTKSIKINPTPNSYYIRALSKEKLEDYYGVLNDYDKIIELGVPPGENDMATMYNNKAYTLVKLKKFNEALPLVNKAIELNPNQWYIWDTRGEIYFQLGYFKKCIEDMTKAISIKPDQNSYFFRGLAKIQMSNKVDGCQDLSKSGELGNANAYTEIKKYCQ